jgi:hypothetical protein
MALPGTAWCGDACHQALLPQEAIMIAHIGDRLVMDGKHLGDARRAGVIIGVGHVDGTPPYQVRWLDDGRTTLIFPGVEARIEPATPIDKDTQATT